MSYLGWILFVLMFVWYVFSNQLCQRKRLALNYYVVYLLLDDEMRTRYKLDFTQLILQANAKDAQSLLFTGCDAIQKVADRLQAGGADGKGASALGALAMMWKVKKDS